MSHFKGIEAFCDKECERIFRDKKKSFKCEICGKKIMVRRSIFDKRRFCGRKCMGIAVRDRSKNLTPQYRSFVECALVILLRKNFNDLPLTTNDRKILDGNEIDIFIPSLRAGIEVNGPHHFKPVYGEKVFAHTKKRDREKRRAAKTKNVKIINVNIPYHISYTNKTKIQNLFKKTCKKLNIFPSILTFSELEIFKEQGRKTLPPSMAHKENEFQKLLAVNGL